MGYGWITIPPGYVIGAAYIIGFAMIGALIYPAEWLTRTSAFLAAGFWAMISFNLAVWEPTAPGWGVYGAICLMNSCLFLMPGISLNDRFKGWRRAK